MAASTTVKVATITGAAKDDIFTTATSGLTEDATSSSLNVLANDPGSAKLYSLLQNTSGLTGTTQFPVVTSATLASGAKITINADGTIGYDASGLKGALQSLAEGESFTDSFNYTIRMANGALSTAKATVSLAGVNDAPTLASVTPVAIHDTAAIDNPAPLTGKLAGADVDHGAVLTYGFADGSNGSSDYGTLTLDAATGAYSFQVDAAKLNALAEGENATVSFSVQVTDEHGAKAAPVILTFNLVGANDGPTLASVDAATINDTVADDAATINGQLAGADVDHGAVLTYSFADGSNGASNYGTLTLDATTGAYSFQADAAKLNGLAEGENATVSFSVQVADEHGAKAAPVTLTYNLVGANDAASISGVDTGSVAEDGTLSVSGTLAVSDRDHDQSVFQAPGSLSGTYGDFTFNAATGEWSYALRNGDANVQALASGQTVTDQLVVKSLDGTASDTIVVSIGGADEPVVVKPDNTQPPTIGGGGQSSNPETKFLVNHGQTDINGKQIIKNFDSNDLLAYTNNYDLKSIGLVDTDGDGVKDASDALFVFTHGKTTDPVEVVLIGYTGLTNAQVVPV